MKLSCSTYQHLAFFSVYAILSCVYAKSQSLVLRIGYPLFALHLRSPAKRAVDQVEATCRKSGPRPIAISLQCPSSLRPVEPRSIVGVAAKRSDRSLFVATACEKRNKLTEGIIGSFAPDLFEAVRVFLRSNVVLISVMLSTIVSSVLVQIWHFILLSKALYSFPSLLCFKQEAHRHRKCSSVLC